MNSSFPELIRCKFDADYSTQNVYQLVYRFPIAGLISISKRKLFTIIFSIPNYENEKITLGYRSVSPVFYEIGNRVRYNEHLSQ